MLHQIETINAIRKERENLEIREREILKPLLTDLSLMSTIKEMFIGILAEKPLPPLASSPAQRRKLLFVILYLYAPGVLLGDRFPNGVRKAIVDIFPDASPAVISHNSNDLLFLFENYRDFRDEVTAIFHVVVEKLSIL